MAIKILLMNPLRQVLKKIFFKTYNINILA